MLSRVAGYANNWKISMSLPSALNTQHFGTASQNHWQPANLAELLAGNPVGESARFDVQEATIEQIHEALKAGRLTCRTLALIYLGRIHALSENGPKLNAFINVNPNVLEEAQALDDELRETGQLRPLHGIPVSLKDSIDVQGIPTTVGSALLKNSVATRDAFLTERLKNAGALIIGKNTLGDLSGSSYSTVTGIPRNPYKLDRAPGGSSSGSGVAVAANLTMVAVGEDTLTSVRTPAALTSAVGLRPTTGLISSVGIAPRKKNIDTAGPIARTVTDAARLLTVLAGPDDFDPLSQRTFAAYPSHAKTTNGTANGYVDFTSFLKEDALSGSRIGVGRDFFGGDPEIDALADNAARAIEKAGAGLIDVRFEQQFYEHYIRDGLKTLMPILMYGFRDIFEAYLSRLGPDVPKTVEAWATAYDTELRQSPFPPEEARSSQAILVLKEALKHSSADPEYREMVEQTLPMLSKKKREFFEAHAIDAMIMPYQPSFAEPIVTPIETNSDPSFIPPPPTVMAPNSVAGYGSEGFPMVVVPMGFGSAGLPMGLAMMGLPYSDGQLLGYAYAFEQATKHRKAPSLG
jgi:amidase